MKLNEGILCENERHDGVDETNHDSELLHKKIEFSSPLEEYSG